MRDEKHTGMGVDGEIQREIPRTKWTTTRCQHGQCGEGGTTTGKFKVRPRRQTGQGQNIRGQVEQDAGVREGGGCDDRVPRNMRYAVSTVKTISIDSECLNHSLRIFKFL